MWISARMFVEHGFDAVRVADVGDACGVSEKTVFNYFPSKEALLLDRLEATAEALRLPPSWACGGSSSVRSGATCDPAIRCRPRSAP